MEVLGFIFIGLIALVVIFGGRGIVWGVKFLNHIDRMIASGYHELTVEQQLEVKQLALDHQHVCRRSGFGPVESADSFYDLAVSRVTGEPSMLDKLGL